MPLHNIHNKNDSNTDMNDNGHQRQNGDILIDLSDRDTLWLSTHLASTCTLKKKKKNTK